MGYNSVAVFVRLAAIGSKSAKSREIRTCIQKVKVIQGHRSFGVKNESA